jgi:hypothetical protein
VKKSDFIFHREKSEKIKTSIPAMQHFKKIIGIKKCLCTFDKMENH